MTVASLGQESNSLTRARELIGSQPKLNGFIKTQTTSKFAQVDHNNLLFVATAALTMIYFSLLEASYMFTGTCRRTNHEFRSSVRAREAYAFIQGTGLDIAIKKFNLDYDAETLRDEFNKIFKKSA